MSTALVRSIIKVNENVDTLSNDVIKKANAIVKISSLEHFKSYEKLSPFLHLFKELNPGFQYKIGREPETFIYERVAILFSYSAHAMKNCYKVYGIDSAFLDSIDIPKYQLPELQEICEGLPLDAKVMFQKGHLFALTGRTYNNEMIVFALCTNHGETIDNYDFFFKFLLEDCQVDIYILFHNYYYAIFL